MKYRYLLICAAFSCTVQAQEALLNKVFEYSPAPGQFVHEYPLYEEGDDAVSMAEKCLESLRNQSPVSLGGYGGFITVGFDHPIMNISGQKDFRILGNAFEGSAEPGIVMVSADTNADGIPNDQWYELAGSEYNNPITIHEYEITYIRPENKEQDIPWKDNQGRSGVIENMGKSGSIHRHAHFPQWMVDDTITLKGTCLPDNAAWDKDKKKWVMKSYAYGYVDNYPNSHTEGTSFDIGWAVDSSGQPVSLERIDFIRIYTGVNRQIPSGGVGELSTEVAGVQNLHPVSVETYPTFSSDKPSFYYKAGELFVENTAKGYVCMYHTDGNLAARFMHQGAQTVFSLSLPEGIYLVKTAKGIFKLALFNHIP